MPHCQRGSIHHPLGGPRILEGSVERLDAEMPDPHGTRVRTARGVVYRLTSEPQLCQQRRRQIGVAGAGGGGVHLRAGGRILLLVG